MSAFRLDRVMAATLVIAVVAVIPAAAQNSGCLCPTQRTELERHSEFERRSMGSFAVIQTRPLGGFRSNVGFGYGGNAAYQFRLDHDGFLTLRADAGFVQYGHESQSDPLSPTISGRIRVKVVTNNDVVPLSIGPQLTWPYGWFRPYANVGIGAQLFFTESHVNGSDDSDNFAQTTNQHDATSAWTAGWGVYIPLSERHTKVLLDLGVQYFNGGHAQYLRPGSIQDLPNSQIRITPLESDTRMALVRLGVRVGI